MESSPQAVPMISIEMLRGIALPPQWLEHFARSFPAGLQITPASMRKAIKASVPIEWIISKLCPAPVYERYRAGIKATAEHYVEVLAIEACGALSTVAEAERCARTES